MKDMQKQLHDKRMKKNEGEDLDVNSHPMLKLFDDIKINKIFIMGED